MGSYYYLQNVIPNEISVSYYSTYPHYIKACVMAMKMYGWYYRVNPKWNYSPYYADVKDNSSDQNFLAGSYSNLSSVYRGYIDTVCTFFNTKAMVTTDSNDIFEVHYHATDGSYHSGQLSQSGALSKAKNGSTYTDILHYYYDCSDYTDGDTVSIVTY